MNFEALVEALPPELAEAMAKQIAAESPHIVESSIRAVASINYDVKINIVPNWKHNAEDAIEQTIRYKLAQEVKQQEEGLAKALVDFLNQQDMKRLYHFQELLDEIKEGQE